MIDIVGADPLAWMILRSLQRLDGQQMAGARIECSYCLSRWIQLYFLSSTHILCPRCMASLPMSVLGVV